MLTGITLDVCVLEANNLSTMMLQPTFTVTLYIASADKSLATGIQVYKPLLYTHMATGYYVPQLAIPTKINEEHV